MNCKYGDNTSSRIRGLDLYLDSIGQFPELTNDEAVELVKLAQSGDIDARNKLMESNLRIVVEVAKQHIGKGVQLLDLIEYGNLAMIHAIDHYDVNCKTKFSTFLYICVDLTIRRKRAKEICTVNYGYYTYYLVGTIKRFCDKFFIKNGRNPYDDEILEALPNVKQDVIDLYRLTIDKQMVLSGNLIYDENDCTLFETLGDDDTNYEKVDGRLTREKMIEDINNLKIENRAKDIILLRYGFVDGKPYTLEEIGEKYAISRERVRQIEVQTLSKIRKAWKF